MKLENGVWVFSGAGSQFPSGVFTTRANAEVWIARNRLTGVLTCYPLDVGVFDWAVQQRVFKPKSDRQQTPNFIGAFSSASQEHYHYEDGKCCG